MSCVFAIFTSFKSKALIVSAIFTLPVLNFISAIAFFTEPVAFITELDTLVFISNSVLKL